MKQFEIISVTVKCKKSVLLIWSTCHSGHCNLGHVPLRLLCHSGHCSSPETDLNGKVSACSISLACVQPWLVKMVSLNGNDGKGKRQGLLINKKLPRE